MTKRVIAPVKPKVLIRDRKNPCFEIKLFPADKPERFMDAFRARHYTFSPILTERYFFDTKFEMKLRIKVMKNRMAPTPNSAW